MSSYARQVYAMLRLRCPHCLSGPVAKGLFSTHASCPQCGWAYERESGFYAGAIYSLYGMVAVVGWSVSLTLIFAFDWALGPAMGLAGLAVALLLPYLFWLSRTSFIHLDHRFFRH